MSIDERISEALRRLVAGMGAIRIPADPCDADLVLSDVQAELATLRAQLATVTRERDEARAVVELVREECARGIARAQDDATAPCHGLGCGRCADCVSLARAAAARLREALEQRSLTFIGVDDLPGRNVEWRCEMCGRQERDGHAPDCALASVPSAEPSERMLRVAVEVARYCLAEGEELNDADRSALRAIVAKAVVS